MKSKQIEFPIEMVVNHINNNKSRTRKSVVLLDQTIDEIESIKKELDEDNELRSHSQIIDQAVHAYFILFEQVKKQRKDSDAKNDER